MFQRCLVSFFVFLFKFLDFIMGVATQALSQNFAGVTSKGLVV